MVRRLLAASVVLSLTVAARAGVVIDLVPGPPQNGLVSVDVLLSSNDGVLPNIRSYQFDLQSGVYPPGHPLEGLLFNDPSQIFVDPNQPGRWQWNAPMNGQTWFTDDPIPIPRANYMLQRPEQGQLIDLNDTPKKVASVVVELVSPGWFDVTNPQADNPVDEGAFFRSGFGVQIDGNPIRDFSSQNPGEVVGGRVFIPEPATLVLLLVGAAGLMRRRRGA
ncbi:MAG: PEP-CTERM sorting domain-containing protein [Phycisphaerales bacterium]|nr:MAG: PEP-CTERM sorting domain-containing protein [Phycisphaerales bacterium]